MKWMFKNHDLDEGDSMGATGVECCNLLTSASAPARDVDWHPEVRASRAFMACEKHKNHHPG